MTAPWHADGALLQLYLRGDAPHGDAMSLEQHLIHCASCRSRLAARTDTFYLDLVWDRIREQAQAPEVTWVQRLLRRVGVSEADALLVAAAPSLRTSWLLGLLVTMAFVLLAATYGGDRGLALFLLVAPLVPVAGVALAYGPDVDPVQEMAAAAPYPSARLMLMRAAAVLATSLPLVVAGATLLPVLDWSAVGWLLPALGFTALVLAASTWASPLMSAGVVAAAWTGAVLAAWLSRDPTAVLAPALLLLYAALGVAALLVLHLRLRDQIALGRVS